MAKRAAKHQLYSAAEEEAARRTITVLPRSRRQTDSDARDRVAELNDLAAAAGLDVLATQVVKVARPHPAHYIGSGRCAALGELVARCQARQLVFDCELSVVQARNLEQMLGVAVTDRTDLILNIFSRRATSHEGQLQVQLAHCRRQMARLAGLWTHLERQRGGIGLRGGPGEKQMELDRRLLAQRIRRLEAQIEKMAQRKALARRRRRKNGVMTAALVGYTNAGKSSLFNRLAAEEALSDDRLFVTLDSTARRVSAGGAAPYVLSDTVGFIRDLPHDLIEGFRATLADTADSDLLIAVVDVSRPDWRDHLRLVEDMLAGINLRAARRITVFNKIDATAEPARAESSECGRIHSVYLSCRTEAGLDLLRQLIAASAASHLSARA